jgi:hypothetical protein
MFFLEAHFHCYVTPFRARWPSKRPHLQNTRQVGGKCGINSINGLRNIDIYEDIMTADYNYMGLSSPWEDNRSSAKKFPTFNETQKLLTAFTSTRHLSLSWARSIQHTPHPYSSRYILILFFHLHLGLPSGPFPTGLPTKNPLRTSTISHTSHVLIMTYVKEKVKLSLRWPPKYMGSKVTERQPRCLIPTRRKIPKRRPSLEPPPRP